MKKIKLGVIGCGNMSSAILKGIFSEKGLSLFPKDSYEILATVSDINEESFKNVLGLNIIATLNNEVLVENSDFILFAVKPQSFEKVACSLKLKDKVLISIMAGIPISKLSAYSNKIVRVMPNLNAKVQKSINAFSAVGINDEEKSIIMLILSSFGEPFEINESKMNEITGVCGSGPAFIFQFISAFTNKLIDSGFPPNQAKEMIHTLFIGSAENIYNEKNKSISEMVTAVCSKGGTTIEGVNYLNDNNFENMVKEAIQKSINRSGELEKLI